MIKKDKHQHKAPYSKVKIIEDLLIKSDLGKTKWHRIFGLCLVLRPYDNNGNTLVNSSFKHIQLSLIHISEPTRRTERSRMPSSA